MPNELTVEVFAAGKWNGMEFNDSDLSVIASAFNTIGDNLQVPLKMGHNNEQPFTDGQPALGWVKDLWVEGGKLFAKFSDMPTIVYDAMKAKLYKNVSIELIEDVEYKDNKYSWVMTGVALLGADIPAVNTLADLTNYMSKILKGRKVTFTSLGQTHNRSINMSDHSEEIKTLKSQIVKLEAEVEKLITTNMSLKAAAIENTAKFSALADVEKHRKAETERKTLSDKLESMVTEKKVAPFTRDSMLADYDQKDEVGKAQVIHSVDTLEATINANPAYFGAEQARNTAQLQKDEDGKDASAIVVDRTRKFMAEHGEKNFGVAKTAVLRADTELANRYTRGEA